MRFFGSVSIVVIVIGAAVATLRGPRDERLYRRVFARDSGPSVAAAAEGIACKQAPTSQANDPRAADFTGPENTGPSRATLSAGVRSDQRAAIEAAWRAGDFARAAQLAAALAQLEDRRRVLRPLLADWASAGPHQAAEFAQAQPAGAERHELLEVAIRAWAERDVAAASAWLDGRESHADLDGAVVAIATSDALVARRPEIALSWAESVVAPTARWEAICTIVESWSRRDAAAAIRAVAHSRVLTPEERTRIVTHASERIATVD